MVGSSEPPQPTARLTIAIASAGPVHLRTAGGSDEEQGTGHAQRLALLASGAGVRLESGDVDAVGDHPDALGSGAEPDRAGRKPRQRIDRLTVERLDQFGELRRKRRGSAGGDAIALAKLQVRLTREAVEGLELGGRQREPAVLVLDDPLSALDVHTEAEVERALRRVLGAVTALVGVPFFLAQLRRLA